MRQLSPVELRDYLQQTDTPPLLLDVREPWEFQHCHIEGSRLLPMGQIPSASGELDPAAETVVICHHGVRSQQVAWFLERSGFSNVINLTGGIDAWARDVDPAMPTY
ncbi:rhodanese-like domain-containing protein [Thioalkalivibrio sp. ALJ16]|uniref:rhodanese-like domain-containing protein n=1 Tax=Thioalkalivibrio sp. ALJ16 TaxID=1158762 RepID=UPI000380D0B5|nr:rhodanese-like domain-containing protein [Thioalkalivibrio sp. ALJ16]